MSLRTGRSALFYGAVAAICFCCRSPLASPAASTTLAEHLYTSYTTIRTVSCEIRKTVTTGDETVRWLSRVHYRKPDCIHVENVAPFKRRIIADGKRLYYYMAGHARGFSKPVPELGKPMLSTLRSVPGTPVEHLTKIVGLPETHLPGTKDSPTRRGYMTERLFVVLSCDASNRLARVDFFKTPKMSTPVAKYVYSSFVRTKAGVWMARRHSAELLLPDGRKIAETRRIDNLAVDEPIADSLFDASIFFEDIEFVSDLSQTVK